jgi:hypothetical protein
MKPQSFIFAIAVVAITNLACGFEIDWFTLDGGGGTSSNNTYVLSGTIGQPDAGSAMTGGAYSVQGGFWSGAYAVQTPGAPFLSITRAGADVILSWVPPTPGFVLQETPALSPMNWQNAPSGVTNPITIPASGASKFYRLLKP